MYMYVWSVCFMSILFVWSGYYMSCLCGLSFFPSYFLHISAFHTRFFGGGGRSLWGTATASCMSLQHMYTQRLYKFSSFLGGEIQAGGGGIFQGPPLYETLYIASVLCTCMYFYVRSFPVDLTPFIT